MARPKNIEAALFDFDGTLCDTEGLNLRHVQGVLRSMGADVSLEELIPLTGGNDLEVLPPLLGRHHAHGTIEDYERLRDGNMAVYRDAGLAVEPGAVDLLEGLRARGVRCAVVSSTASRCILTALDRLALLPLFDVVVCGDMLTHRKPHPEPFQRALELLGVDAAHAVVFEDTPTGIASGHAAGCYVIGYRGCSVELDTSAADEAIDTFVGFSLG